MQYSVQEQLERLERDALSGSVRRVFCLWGLPGIGKSHALWAKFRAQGGQVLKLDLKNSAQDWSKVSVLLLDDLHLIPEGESWALEQASVLAPPASGPALWVTHRSPLPAPFINLECLPLPRLETQELLEDQLHGIAPPEALEWIYSRTRGHPQFALEYVCYLTRQGFLWSDGERWRWRTPPLDFLPPTVEALISGWLENLGSLEKRSLEQAALMAQQMPTVALPALEAEVQSRLERLGFWRGEGLSHPLLGQALLAGLSAQSRREHARELLMVLEALGRDPGPALLSEAQLEGTQGLNTYLRLAGSAAARGDGASEGQWKALAARSSEGYERIRLSLEAAQALRSNDLEQAAQLASGAASSVPHDTEALYLCFELDLERGFEAQAEMWLELLPDFERASRRVWELHLKLLHRAHPRHGEALILWDAHPEFQGNADPEVVLLMGSILGQRGAFEDAFALSGPLLERPHLTPFLRCRALEFQATLHYLQGHLVSAETYGAQALLLARTLERPSYLAKLLQKQHVTLMALDRMAEAESLLRAALELYGQYGSALELAHTQSSLGKLLGELGPFEEAETLLLGSLSILEKLDSAVLRCDAAIGLASLYVFWKPPYAGPLVLKYARLARTLADQSANQQLQHLSLVYLAHGESLYGDPQTALAYARESAGEQYIGPSQSRAARSRFVLGLALEATGQHELALEVMRESLLEYERLGDLYQANVYGLELDRITADLDSARARHSWFMSSGLLGKAKLAVRYFPALEHTVLESASPPTGQPAPERPRLLLLGPTLLEREGQRVAYRGRKRVELLAYLLEVRVGGRSEATLLELMDALYPGAGEREARATLKQLAYLLRGQLGPSSILSTAHGYALGDLDSDVETFLKTRDPALWRGPYLLDLEESGTPLVRDALLSGLSQLAQHLLEHNPGEVARLGQIWLEMEPYSLEALRLTVQAESALGQTRAASRTYRVGRERLLEVRQTLPDSLEGFLEQSTT